MPDEMQIHYTLIVLAGKSQDRIGFPALAATLDDQRQMIQVLLPSLEDIFHFSPQHHGPPHLKGYAFPSDFTLILYNI